jgi:pimeloyl-ACP methyl ester carboxylesterase
VSAEPPTPRRDVFVRSADGTRIAYEEHGPQDAPGVVLSHGWTCSARFWAPVVRLLAADHRVIAYDQRGHGRSARPADPALYGTAQLADDLEAVLCAALPDAAPAVLAGHSMGGMTLMAAADRPAVQARTAAVLLASTGSSRLPDSALVLPPRVRSRRLRRAFHRSLLVSSAPLGPPNPLLRKAFAYGLMGPGATAGQVDAVTRIVAACDRRTRGAWGRVLAGLDLDAGVAALAAPAAVLVGTADKLTPPALAHSLAARLPDGLGVTELPGLGHMTPVEDPAAVAGLVRDLAATYPAARGTATKEGESA